MVDAVCRVPGKSEAYFFSGTRFMRVKYTSGEADFPVYENGKHIRSEWKTLGAHNIGVVDAVVQVPGESHDIYVFSGAKYLRLRMDKNDLSDSVVTPLTPIESEWKTLARYGFDRIDAAMVVPGSENNIYFFRGKEWIDVSRSDKLIASGTIKESWPSLVEAGFETVDAILPNEDDTYYVFSGDKYVRIRMKKSVDEKAGPVRDLNQWASLTNWPYPLIKTIYYDMDSRSFNGKMVSSS